MRGYQKKVIFLKNTGSHLFDEAYFVVSREGENASVGQSDMVVEANRIIKESLEDCEERLRRERGKRKGVFLIPFFLGACISAAAAIIIYLVSLLI